MARLSLVVLSIKLEYDLIEHSKLQTLIQSAWHMSQRFQNGLNQLPGPSHITPEKPALAGRAVSR